MEKAVTQMTQDLRLSTVATGAAEVIGDETLVSADTVNFPELVAKHPTRRGHRQGAPISSTASDPTMTDGPLSAVISSCRRGRSSLCSQRLLVDHQGSSL